MTGRSGDRLPTALTDAVPELVGDDPVMNLLVLVGPPIVLAVAILGRTLPGLVLAASYNLAFVVELAVRAVRTDGDTGRSAF